MFKSWGWSWKKPCYRQLLKYTSANIDYYSDFLLWLWSVDPRRCKFADESHFVSCDLYCTKCLGPRGQKMDLICGGNLKTSVTMTILTDVSDNAIRPVYAQLREESNTQWDFLLFVCDALDAGHLSFGDFLIVDNASVHKGDATFGILQDTLESYGVTLIYLPKYSPELNPCEFIFGLLKNHLRHYRKTDEFLWELTLSLAKITPHKVLKNYFHCRHQEIN